MKRKIKALTLILLAPFLVFAFYIGSLWATYIDQTIKKTGSESNQQKNRRKKTGQRAIVANIRSC
jgi:hypothetical protein